MKFRVMNTIHLHSSIPILEEDDDSITPLVVIHSEVSPFGPSITITFSDSILLSNKGCNSELSKAKKSDINI